MDHDIYSFYELVQAYKVKIPIMQRDYAQGRTKNLAICRNFLKAIKESIVNGKTINLDFIYGNVEGGVFLPLDGQQRLTTLFLLHWYGFVKETELDRPARETLKNFTYETRISSRRFCSSLLEHPVSVYAPALLSEQILDSKWFFLSWKQDATIRAMLKTIDMIHEIFQDVDDVWDALANRKNVIFHLLILENFGLSDDLYIKMNARGRVLTPFENLKAEIQDKSAKENWEEGWKELDKFSYKIDVTWTDFLWRNFRKDNSVDNAHMDFITTIVMAKLSTGQLLKGAGRIEVIRRLNDSNSDRELIKYIDEKTFRFIYDAYEMYCGLVMQDHLPLLNIDMWRHTPEKHLLYEILLGTNTSYTHKVLFYAQTEYLLRNQPFVQERYEEWMRVVRNIVSRADITVDGKRNDLVRSPEAFYGAINLVSELAEGCGDIYHHLCTASLLSSFAREQVKEEILKAQIICNRSEQKELIFRLEDNELLRGRIMFALECANFRGNIEQIDFGLLPEAADDTESIEQIDFGLLAKIQAVFGKYFNQELDSDSKEFDKLRRAMLTMEIDGKYQYYNYWWSYWYAGEADKRKLFPSYREIEYFIGLDEFKPYFKKLVIQLISKDYDNIIEDFKKPGHMEQWQYRLIKEGQLLAGCKSKYIAIPKERTYCYLLRGRRPSDTDGCPQIV